MVRGKLGNLLLYFLSVLVYVDIYCSKQRCVWSGNPDVQRSVQKIELWWKWMNLDISATLQ
jgi:hypothetical protein